MGVQAAHRLAGTNTYVIVSGCLSLRNHLALREALREKAELRNRYGEMKKQIRLTAPDIDAHGQAKAPIIQKALAAAGLTEYELASIAGNQVPTHQELPR